jgi:hypothetical protein
VAAHERVVPGEFLKVEASGKRLRGPKCNAQQI